MTEWEFTADMASKMNRILAQNPHLGFDEVRCEERGRGSTKRRDLTLSRNGKPVITGEVKLPDRPDGRTPFYEETVLDAHSKADQAGVELFFTWNVNSCVLWKTFKRGTPIADRHIETFQVLDRPIKSSGQLVDPVVVAGLEKFLRSFLERLSAIESGAQPMLVLPLDEKFLQVWERALEPLILDTRTEVEALYSTNSKFRKDLDKWMRDEEGWTIGGDESSIEENLERAVKFSCYVSANKLIFYMALRRKFTRMRAFRVPNSVQSKDDLRKLFEEYFQHARRITSDYETVFRESYGDTLSFLGPESVENWRYLSTQSDAFDFTQVDFEIIGQIFEKLLSTSERHKYGQHYTRSELVDLINSFCVLNAEDLVFDPSCGGGTFLVRAYQRKKDLSAQTMSHEDLLEQLFGLDIADYPAHLTTINLATRNLIPSGNYPRIAREDFFKVNPKAGIFHVPLGVKGGQFTLIEIPLVDAVVGNPPYVKQEKIDESYGEGYKDELRTQQKKEVSTASLSGRSDIYCYFFTHASKFLKANGRIGFLTSASWLDTDYGSEIQKFLLSTFAIEAIFESNCEPWFSGARVTTTGTVLRKEENESIRNDNLVRFIWIKRPLASLFQEHDIIEQGINTYDDLRNFILSTNEDFVSPSIRIRVVKQAELIRVGSTDPSSALSKQISYSPAASVNINSYTGSKWGSYLRAPDLFFQLSRQFPKSLVPLGRIADVRFGLKTGCDDFFYVHDITDELLETLSDATLKDSYGLRKNQTEKLRVVKSGNGSVHLIEAKYLEFEIHNSKEIERFVIDDSTLSNKVFLVSDTKSQLKDTHALKYIQWGERQGYHRGSSVAGHVSQTRSWYDIQDPRRPSVVLPKIQQYRHIAALNPSSYFCNSSLLPISTAPSDAELLCAILNSTVVALYKQYYARLHGREGSIQLDVYAAKMMPIPDPSIAKEDVRKRIVHSFREMTKRESLPLVDVDGKTGTNGGELDLADRWQLDDAVLELIGISKKGERLKIRNQLYNDITAIYRDIRVAELKMQYFRARSARSSSVTPSGLADQILSIYQNEVDYLPVSSFVSPDEDLEAHIVESGVVKLVRSGLFNKPGLKVDGKMVELSDENKAEFLMALIDDGFTGTLLVPSDPDSCRKALIAYTERKRSLDGLLREYASEYTSDEQTQSKIVRELWKKILSKDRRESLSASSLA